MKKGDLVKWNSLSGSGEYELGIVIDDTYSENDFGQQRLMVWFFEEKRPSLITTVYLELVSEVG
jgi:hypothetical protein